MYTRVSDMPFRMTTREVAAALRTTPNTFGRRRREGRYDIEPVERGIELLWDRRDVLRLLGRTEDCELVPTSPVAGEPLYRPGVPQWGVTDPDDFAKTRARQKGSLKPKPRG